MTAHVTTEMTDKRLKGHQAASTFTFIFSLVVLFAYPDHPTVSAISSASILFSLAWMGVTKVRIWWNHG
jgi:hypothetical protein